MLKESPANHTTADSHKSFMDICSSFVTKAKATKLMNPRQRTLDNPSGHSESATAFRIASGQQRYDTTTTQGFPMGLRIISPIALNNVRTLTRTSTFTRYRWNGINQGQQLGDIMTICSAQANSEWNAFRICDRVMFRAIFTPICGVWADFRPPKMARTEALSITARDQSICSAAWSWFNKIRWSLSHTPAFCQSRNRRQQVIPLPHPISLGRSSQGIPVLRTKRIPVKALRLGIGGRPPFGRGFGDGSNGPMISQNSSVSKGLAIIVSSMTANNVHKYMNHRTIHLCKPRFC
jgi:hypothetical protein